jgi:hypothetical protein
MSEATELHRAVGELEGTVIALSQKVEALSKQVEILTALLNQGKGMKYLVVLFPAVIGMISATLGFFGLKLTLTP